MTGNKNEVVFRFDSLNVIKIALILALLAVLFILRDLLLVILTAVVFAASIEPIIKWFKQYRVGRLPAVIIIYVFVAIILIGTLYFLLVPLLNEASSLLTNLPSYVSSADLWSPLGEGTVIGSQKFIQDLSATFSVQDIVGKVQTVTSNLSAGIFSTISYAFGGALSLFLIIVLSFYLAVQENGIRNFLTTVTPFDNREYVLGLWTRAERKIGLWFQGQILLSIIIAILVYLGLTIIGVEHSLLLAVLAGLFELVPLFGPVLAAIPAVIIAFISGGGVTGALIVIAFYVVVQQFENQLIYPLVVNKVVGVPAIIVIIALIAGGTLAGFLGLLLSVPIAAILMEFFTDVQKGTFVKKV